MEYQRKYYAENREAVKAASRLYKRSVEGLLHKRAAARALAKGLEFTLKVSDIVVPEVCPVFGVPMVRNTPYAPSLDRIDSTKGYTKDNIQVISNLANTMKSNATNEELRRFADWILNQNE